MPVETIECQIVQSQLGRYLSGEAFTNEALSQIEDHVADCDLCRGEVAVRRASLQSLLGLPTPEASRPEALLNALRENEASSTKTIPTHAVVEQTVTELASPSPSKKPLSKPLLYGAALSVVLVAMSYIGRNPTSVFGDRAATSTISSTSTTVAPGVESAPAPTPEPLNLDEWSMMGLDAYLAFDSTDASTLESWEWLSISEWMPAPVEGSNDTTQTATNASTTEETLGTSAPIDSPTVVREPQSQPKPEVAPKPTPERPVRAKKQPEPAAPKSQQNVIRIYAPGQ